MRYLILLLIFPFSIQAQTPYNLQTGRELGILGGGAGLSGFSVYLDLKTRILSPEEIRALDANTIPGIDRWSVNYYSLAAQKASDRALLGSFAFPSMLFFSEAGRRDAGKVGLMQLQTLLLNYGLTNVTKTLVKRPRPYLYNNDVPLELKLKRSARYSFFSGHTSMAAANSFLTAKIYDDLYPDSDATPFIWGLAALVPAYTGLKRIKGGKHFFTDVLVGYLVGAGVGILIPAIHK